jgi:hypothetical protein
MVPTPLILAALMNTKYIRSRRIRGIFGVSVMGAISLGTCGAAAAWIEKNHVDRTIREVDWTDIAFGPAFAVYLFQGIFYSVSVSPAAVCETRTLLSRSSVTKLLSSGC